MNRATEVQARYYVLTKESSLSHEKAISKLSKEFNLTPKTIKKYLKTYVESPSLKHDLEIAKLEVQLKDVRIRNAQLLNQIGSVNSVIDKIVSNITPIDAKKLPSPQIHKKPNLVNAEMVALFSDPHYNRVVNPLTMGTPYSYNFYVASCRLWKWTQDIITTRDRLSSAFNLNTLHIDLLGDNINDEHRDENKHTNEFPNSLGVIFASVLQAQSIIYLSHFFEHIVLTGVVGNESRIMPKKPSKIIYHNYDFLFYHMVSAYLNNYMKKRNIEFNIPLAPKILVKRQNHTSLLFHGDTVMSWAGLPVYGLMRLIKEEQTILKAQGGFDTIECGHFHVSNELSNELLIVNGAFCGPDEYSQNTLHKYGISSQNLHILYDGNIEMKRTIKLDQVPAKHPFIFDSDYTTDISRNVNLFEESLESFGG